MKQDSQQEHPEESHGSHRVGTLREHLVRETLSDLENRLTADHHLEEHPEADRPADPLETPP